MNCFDTDAFSEGKTKHSSQGPAISTVSSNNRTWLRGTTVAVSIGLLINCSALNASTSRVSITAEQPNLAPALATDKHRIGQHVYLAAGFGASRLDPDTSEVATFDVNDRVKAGGQITLGVDVVRQLSLELHSADLGGAGLSPQGRINYQEYGASALFYIGKNRHRYKRQGLTGYARLGIGVFELSADGEVPFADGRQGHILLGAGLEYMAHVGFGVRAEIISFVEDAQFAQVALIYRMGSTPTRRPPRLPLAPKHEATVESVLVKATETK